ncbi:hypothetical protein [uncultured Thermanaerothrix sp.]|uniref:hypothetical protein n=1 Tax=uncultured Thermanaerothrix sp. TaxID=1195149 RepID=UPI00261C7AC0|nr:hypothetical protein [uncultured Thermanaerothrix sp.]
MRSPVATAIAIGVGLIVLLGYLLPLPVLDPIRRLFLDWSIILAAVAGLVAILNLFKAHWRKISSSRERDYYSLFFILGFILTAALGLLFGPTDERVRPLIMSIQLPVEASLVGLLTITFVVSAVRLFALRRSWMSGIFLASTIVFLLAGSGVFLTSGTSQVIKEVLAALNILPAAGARGILLGIALGSVLTGLRVLLGMDRPYSE